MPSPDVEVWTKENKCVACWMRYRSSAAVVLMVATVAIFTDCFIYGCLVPYTPVYSADFKLNDEQIGLVMSAYAVTLVVCTPVAGIVCDKWGSYVPFTVGIVAEAAITALFAIAPSLPLVIAGRFLQGLSAAFTWTAALALVDAVFPSTADESSNGRAMGIASAGASVGSMAGPPVAGLLLQRFGYAAPFLLAAALCVTDAVLRVAFVGRHPRPMQAGEPGARFFGFPSTPGGGEPSTGPGAVQAAAAATEHTPLLGSVQGGDADTGGPAAAAGTLSLSAEVAATLPVLRQLLNFVRQPTVLLLLLMTFGTAFSITALEISYPLRMTRVWHATPEQIGVVFGVFDIAYGLSGVLGGYISDKLSRHRAAVLAVGSLAFGGSMFLVMFSGSFLACSLVMLGVGVLCGLGTAGIMPLISEAAAAGGTGSGLAFSLWNASYGIGMAVGPVVGGLLSQYLSFQYVTFVLAAIVTAPVLPFIAVAAAASRRQHRLQTEADAAAAAAGAVVPAAADAPVGGEDERV